MNLTSKQKYNKITPILKISIVIYNHDFSIIQKNIESIIKQKIPCFIILVDHSPNNRLEKLIQETYDPSLVQYFYRGNSNSGYGGGNNFAFAQKPATQYFLVLNPDIEMNPNVLTTLVESLKKSEKIGLTFPKVTNIDGTIQFNVKSHPKLLALAGRRFGFLNKINLIQKSMDDYECKDFNYSKSNEVEYVGGCFMLLRSSVFKEVLFFDEDFFLYFEDYDLCAKIKKAGYTINYNSKVTISHGWNRGSHKSFLLFRTFIASMIRFFMKWGIQWL